MNNMELIGLIFLGIILFVVLGVFGWLTSIFGVIIEWLFDGCLNSIGCLFWIVLIILLLMTFI